MSDNQTEGHITWPLKLVGLFSRMRFILLLRPSSWLLNVIKILLVTLEQVGFSSPGLRICSDGNVGSL